MTWRDWAGGSPEGQGSPVPLPHTLRYASSIWLFLISFILAK